MTQTDFARKIKTSQQTVSNVCRGLSTPRKTVVKIVKATKGEVTVADIWPDKIFIVVPVPRKLQTNKKK